MSEMLAASAIAEHVIEARGYDKVHRPDDARALGFSNRACARVTDTSQALIIPIWDVQANGRPTGLQMRPTRTGPPSADGKEAPKYETPFKQPNMLDVNPLMRPHVLDGNDELWITEGAKKADALASLGVPCIALSGVWNWRGKETAGEEGSPSAPLPQWDLVPLKDRSVVICYDSDVSSNDKVRQARHALAVFLTVKGADVRYGVLQNAPGGGKQGIDDHLAAGGLLSEVSVVPADDVTKEEVKDEAKRIKTREWLRKRKEAGEKVSGYDLVERTVGLLRRYVVLPDDHSYLAVALWVIHTHLVMEFDSTPRLAFLAPEAQCGKTRALEVIEPLVRNPDRFFNASESVMFRTIEQDYDTHKHVTLLIDETDAIFPQRRGEKPDPAKESVRAIINAGHRKGSVVKRSEVVGKSIKLAEFRVYAPTALAGIGTLPDTVIDRSVVIHMRRRKAGETVEPLRFRDIAKNFSALAKDIADWVLAHEKGFRGFYPDMPAGVVDRPADVWEPLIAVADRTGHGRAARDCCLAFVSRTDAAPVSEGVQLLVDVRRAFAEAGQEKVPSAWLVERLCSYEDTRWRMEWFTQIKLASMLRDYDVGSKKIRFDTGTLQGYERHEFEDVWARYCPSSPSTPHTPEHPEQPERPRSEAV